MDFELAVNNFGDTRSGGLAGPMGLFIIVLMAISTVLLIRNMNKRLRRLPDSFDNVDASKRGGGKVDPAAREATGESVETAPSADDDRSRSRSGETNSQVSDVDPGERHRTEDRNAP